MAAVGHFGCPKITFDLISGHFRSMQILKKILFTKWLLVVILDVRKSLSISFRTIHFTSIRNFIFFEIVDKMVDVGHFGCPNYIFDGISGHFRSIRNF